MRVRILQTVTGPARRRTVSLLFAAFIVLGVVVAAHEPILSGVGGLLLASQTSADLPGTVDVIVITLDAGAAGVLDAADLVAAGVSSRVAVFTEPLNVAEQELVRRGLPRDDLGTRLSRQLQALGVLSVEVISREVDGSHQAGLELPSWLRDRAYRSAIVITEADHSRRVDRILRRSMQGQHATVFVRAAKYSSFNPEKWWLTRSGLRMGIVELQKLLLDVIQHPLQPRMASLSTLFL
jgi:hypothetical protein